MRITHILLPALLATLSAAAPAADAVRGKQLHDSKCVACHVQKYGGDGSTVYTRENRLIKDHKALGQRVAACNAMVNAGLFPEDEAAITAYLAERFYKFAK